MDIFFSFQHLMMFTQIHPNTYLGLIIWNLIRIKLNENLREQKSYSDQ
jgi:hypothetical protein